MATQYLDKEGLSFLVSKIKNTYATKNELTSTDTDDGDISTTDVTSLFDNDETVGADVDTELTNYYTKSEVDTALESAGKVKTVNNVEPDASGNITISAGGHEIVDTVPTVDEMQDDVVYYVPTEGSESGSSNDSTLPEGADYVSEYDVNGTEWYRKWKSGWLEQGGYISLNSTGTVTYQKAFADTNYTITVSSQRTSNNGFVRIVSLAATSVSFKFEWDVDQSKSGYCRWYACGMGADK